jgi:type VI protein secretion system component VasF
VDFERPDQPEQIDEFERELKQALERRPAPPSLKRHIMQQRSIGRTRQIRIQTVWWQRLAASVLLVGVIAGGYSWRQQEERRKGEAAKQQVLTALRITNHALNDMNRRLVEHSHAEK